MSNQPLSDLTFRLAALNQEQRFYQLRFMWVTIQALEKLGIPTKEVEEMRGLYQSLADGTTFSQHINQQKGADPEGQPQN